MFDIYLGVVLNRIIQNLHIFCSVCTHIFCARYNIRLSFQELLVPSHYLKYVWSLNLSWNLFYLYCDILLLLQKSLKKSPIILREIFFYSSQHDYGAVFLLHNNIFHILNARIKDTKLYSHLLVNKMLYSFSIYLYFLS